MASQASLRAFRLEAETGVVYEEANGVRVAVDRIYRVILDGVHHGDIVAMPANLEDAALGLLVSELRPDNPREARVRIIGDTISISVGMAHGRPGRLLAEGCGGAASPVAAARVQGGAVYTWSDIASLYPDFASRTAGNLYRVSAHTVAIYSLDGGRVVVAHDTSRHTAVLKAVGLAYKTGLLAEGGRLAAASTGRASADMVYRLSSVRVGLMVTMRGPLASGLNAARNTGTVLVSNAKRGRGRALVVLAGRLSD